MLVIIIDIIIFLYLFIYLNHIYAEQFKTSQNFLVLFLSDRKVFLATWKDIPAGNEVQNQITNVNFSSGKIVICAPDSRCCLWMLH